MALSLQDLDALIADPTVGAVHSAARAATGANAPAAIPSLSPKAPAIFPGVSLGQSQITPSAVTHPTATPTTIPSMSAAAPSVGAGPTEAPAGIPAISTAPIELTKPKTGWQKLEHGLATAGNIAGDIVAPGTMALIPGTQLHKEWEQKREAGLGAEQARTGLETAQTGEAEANAWKALHPEASAEAEMNFRAQAAEGLGLKPGTPEYQQFVGTGKFQRFPEQKLGQTPQEQTYDSLMKGGTGGGPMVNPKTQKPYTAQEALAETQKTPRESANQDRERYEDILANEAQNKPVPPEDKAWADAYAKAGSLSAQVAAQAGTYQPLYGKNPDGTPNGQVVGFYDSKNPRAVISVAGTPGAPSNAAVLPGTTAQGSAATEKQIAAFNKDYVDPANAIERSYDMFQDAYDAIKRGDAKTGAEDMLLLSQHLATTFGQVKGSRMNKDLIQEHKDAIGMQDKLERFANNVASGQQLSPDQREEFNGLITNMRNLTWQIAAKEANRRNQPVNFLPANVHVKMQDSKGVTREVSGDQVQGYLDKGIKFAE